MESIMEYPNGHPLLVFSFRYALGRTSAAPSIMVEILLNEWNNIGKPTRDQISQEIQEAMTHGMAGMPCDVNQWQKILDRAKEGVE